MPPVNARDLYDHDFFEWTRSNAALLRAGRLAEADLAHIAEEIEDMGKSQQHEIENRMEVLLRHLLKWQFQSGRRSRSWRLTANNERRRIERLLRAMPSLCPRLVTILPEAYAYAVRAAADETDLPKSAFPASCPWSLDQVLDETFLPE